MEESISYLMEQFRLEDQDIRTYSPLTLAYIGDGIYELYIRTILVKQGNCQANKLHRRASRLVKAPPSLPWLRHWNLFLLPRRKQYTKEEEMQNPTPLPKMQQWANTAGRPDLRR